MARPFQKMRGLLAAEGVEQTDLARILNRSITYVSQRYMGRAPWTADEMYAILELVDQPSEKLHEIFPPRKEAKERQACSSRRRLEAAQ